MKFTPFITFLLALTFTFSLFSCGDDDDNGVICGDNFSLNAALEAELRDLTRSAQAYAQDATEENCSNYKTSLNVYIDAAADYKVCAIGVGQQGSYDQAIANARTDAEALMCP